MKKQKFSLKQKLLDVWSKVKRPLFYCSIALNILFVAIAIVGCIVPSKRDGSSTSNESESIQFTQRKNMLNETITDLTNTSWTLNQPLNITYNYTFYVNVIIGETNYDRMEFQTTSGFSNKQIYVYDSVRGVSNSKFSLVSHSEIAYLSYFTFSGGSEVTSSSLINWCQSCCNQYIEPTPEPEPEPEYNNYEQVSQIFLGDSFVPSVYIASNGNFIFNGFGGYMNNPDTFVIDFTGLTFESNGRIYNRVRFLYLPLTAGATFVTQDGSTGTDVTSFTNYEFCNGIYYMNYDEDHNLLYSNLVASPRRKVVNVNGNNLNIFDVRVPFLVWVNGNYRELTIIEDTHQVVTDSNLIYSNMSAVELLQVTSNVNQSVTGLSNVTDILKGGFSSLSSILQMNILPGITIGLLLFIPLIVTIILTILKLVKK